MNFRFTLTHDVLGSHEINEPDGWKDCKIKLERHKDFRSLLEYFDGDFIFYGSNGVVDGGLDFIKEVEQAYGIDATIEILIEVSFDGFTYDDLFEGQLNLSGIQEVQDNKAQIPIIRDDFWAKFINRLETPVDLQSPLSLDDEALNVFESIRLKLTSQVIQKQTIYQGLDGTTGAESGSDNFLIEFQVGLPEIRDEIQESYEIPFAENATPINVIELFENGDITVDANGRFIFQITASQTIETVNAILRVRRNDGTELSLGSVSDSPMSTNVYVELPFLGSQNYNGNEIGDLFYLYVEFGVTLSASGSINYSISIDGTITFEQQTFVPDSTSESFFLHDAAGQIADRIISRDESFYSEFLGSQNTIYRQYDVDGCAWKYALLKGLQLRQYSLLEKPFFLSFKQWWEGANPILCLGLGYETINGVQVVRVEKLEDFYDASETSLDISNVRQITRLYDQEVIFKTIKVGYKKWQSEDISGIDDPQTKHTYATRFQKVGKEFQIESDFIAASLAIETTRRTTKEKSADYKFDNETFIIALNPIPVDVSPETSPDVTDYSPELDENFDSVTNLLNAETRYNLRITPARNLIRWIRYVSGALQSYLSSTFKFTSGEGNYDMVSDMSNVSDGCDEFKPSLGESEDIPVYADPLHLALAYEIVIPLEWEDYLLIRENRKKAIGISQTTVNHAKFFIDTLEYELVKGVATIKAWPVTYFDLQVIESETFMRSCEPVITEVCEDAYLTENSFELITEGGDCLILE